MSKDQAGVGPIADHADAMHRTLGVVGQPKRQPGRAGLAVTHLFE